MISKILLRSTIDELPENFTVEEIIEKIVLLDKIQEGLEDIKAGRVFSTEEMKSQLSQWLK